MTDKYEALRAVIDRGLADDFQLKRATISALLADHDAKHTALELVRMSAGWQYMSDETRQVVIAALTQGEQNADQ